MKSMVGMEGTNFQIDFTPSRKTKNGNGRERGEGG